MNAKQIAKAGLIGALYAVLTIGLAPIAFGPMQFRVAEMLKPLLFRSPIYLVGLVVGMVVGNFFSPFGLLDTAVMPGLIFVAGVAARHIPNRWAGCIFMAGITSVGVAMVLHLAIHLPFFITAVYIFVPEVILYVIGELVWKRFDTSVK